MQWQTTAHYGLGKILIGVTDNEIDAQKIEKLDRITPKKIGKRFVVGVNREAKVLGISVEAYLAKWKIAIRESDLSDGLKSAVLSHIDFNSFYGLGIIIITVPAQHGLSFVGEDVYWREGDATVQARGNKQVADLAQRFTVRT